MDYRGGVHYDDYGNGNGPSGSGYRERGRRDRDSSRDRDRNGRSDRDRRGRDRDRDRDNDRGHGRGRDEDSYDRRRERDDSYGSRSRDRYSSNGNQSYGYSGNGGGGDRVDRNRDRDRGEDRGYNGGEEDRSRVPRDGSNGNGNGNGFERGRAGGGSTRRPRSFDRNGAADYGEPSPRRQRTDSSVGRNSNASSEGAAPGPSRGRGAGRGRGGPTGANGSEGRRGRRVRFVEDNRPIEERYDFVNTRSDENRDKGKQGRLATKDKKVSLMANYFPMKSLPGWKIYHYHVDFVRNGQTVANTDEDSVLTTNVKKDLLRQHHDKFGNFIFDGGALFSSNTLQVPMELKSELRTWNRRPDNAAAAPAPAPAAGSQNFTIENIQLVVTLVADLEPGDPSCLQFYNLIMRNCLEHLRLELVKRNYYDPHQAKEVPGLRLVLWPGYITSIRNHENSLMLNVEIVHRVLRYDKALDILRVAQNNRESEEQIKRKLVGSVIMTTYNRKTYTIHDVDFDKNPMSTFGMRDRTNPGKNVDITYVDYYRGLTPSVEIRDQRQPLLGTRPQKKDFHRGKMRTVWLIPELCQMTGMDDEIRKNWQTMRAIANVSQQRPQDKLRTIQTFMNRLQQDTRVQEEFAKWNLRFQPQPVSFDGRVLGQENILMGKNKIVQSDQRNDEWTSAFRNCEMFKNKGLVRNWCIVVPNRDAGKIDNLINTMRRVGQTMNFPVQQPIHVEEIGDIRAESYSNAIDKAMHTYGKDLQMLFFVLPNNKEELWRTVKKRTLIDYGVCSQCFLAKHFNNQKGLMSIVTKVVIQINAKLGGVPWSIENKSDKNPQLMVIGYDTHSSGKGTNKVSVGATVATTNQDFTRFYSTTHPIYQQAISEQMRVDIVKCVNTYQQVNDGTLPARIIFYRAGVGEGQLNYVHSVELKAIQDGLAELYRSHNQAPPKFTFIVVTKRINTRFFLPSRPNENVTCGTIVDDVVTLPERFDFYLVSQHARQGTVSPTAYNVIFDQQGQTPDKLQRFTYKLTHMYYNWSGPVSAPAVCQNAKKLAFMTGQALNCAAAHERLSQYLYFL